MATRDAITAKVIANLNDPGFFYSSTDLNDSIQDGYDEIVSLTGCIPKATRINFTANKTYYDLPALISDFVALRAIYNSVSKRWLIPKSPLWMEAQRDDWELQLGQPEYLAAYNYRYTAIYPRVASTVTNGAWVFYYASADALTGSTTPNLPSVSGDIALESYVTADLFEQAEEWTKAQEYYSEYVKLLSEVDNYRNSLRLPDYLDGLKF